MLNKSFYKNSDYVIYTDGRCYSNKTHKFLTPKMSVKYPTYNLTLPEGKKQIKIHRMVAETFIPNPENKPIVNHKDGDTHNYNIDNLEWVTEKENSKHAVQTGLLTKSDQTAVLLSESYIENEEWRPISGYSNYLISNFGRVLNKGTKKLKKTPLDNNGYPHTNLWKNNKGKTFQIHRLEYASFYPDENLENYVINHKDGDKTNNKLTNLEKTTYSENNLHAEYVSKKHTCGKPVLQLDKEGNVINTFASISEAQRETKTYCISRAIKKNYCANGYYWKYKEN